VKLAERLLSSLDPQSREQIDKLWAQEAEARVDAFEQGKIKTTSARRAFEATRKKTT